MAQPSEIAVCCPFLASDEASFVTGAVLVADGGGRAPLQSRGASPEKLKRATIGSLTRYPGCFANSLSSRCGTTL
jgi:hypothetical protein